MSENVRYSEAAALAWQLACVNAVNGQVKIAHLLSAIFSISDLNEKFMSRKDISLTVLQRQAVVREQFRLKELLVDNDLSDPRFCLEVGQASGTGRDADKKQVIHELLEQFGCGRQLPNGSLQKIEDNDRDIALKSQFERMLPVSWGQRGRPVNCFDLLGFCFICLDTAETDSAGSGQETRLTGCGEFHEWVKGVKIDAGHLIDFMKNAAEAAENYAHMTHLIIPFAFDMEPQKAIDMFLQAKTVQASARIWAEETVKNERMFGHINHLIGPGQGHPQSIGQCLSLQPAGRDHYQIPAEKEPLQFAIKSERGKRNILVTFGEINLFFFETRVGFLDLNVSYSADADIDEIITANYALKKMSISTLRRADGQELRVAEICTRLLNNADRKESIAFDAAYFEYLQDKRNPSHAHVYSALFLERDLMMNGDEKREDWQSELMEILFRLRRSFKESYKPAAVEFDPHENPQILQLFENSYWGISQEGLANVVYLTGDPVTNSFFDTDAAARNKKNAAKYYPLLNSTYLYIYIISLHQRYALINLANLAADLPGDYRRIKPESGEDAVSAKPGLAIALQEQIAFFKLRALFCQLGNNDHHNRLYNRICSILGIRELLDELEQETSAIKALMDNIEIKQRWEESEAKREKAAQEKKDQETRKENIDSAKEKEQRALTNLQYFIGIVGAFYAAVQFSDALWNMLRGKSFWTAVVSHIKRPEWIVALVIGAVVIGFINFFSRWQLARNELKMVKAENRKQENDGKRHKRLPGKH